MKCPYCDSEMEQGFIQSRDVLGWSKKKHVPAALAGALSEVELGSLVEAHNCPACKKIVIAYEGFLS